MTKLPSESTRPRELQNKVSNHPLRCNIGTLRKVIFDIGKGWPDGSNHLNGQCSTGGGRNTKPKHRKNTSTDNTEIRQIHAEAAPNDDRKGNVKTSTGRTLKGNRDGDEDEACGDGSEGLFPVQTAGKKGRSHLPDGDDECIGKPISDVIIHPPCSILGKNGVEVLKISLNIYVVERYPCYSGTRSEQRKKVDGRQLGGSSCRHYRDGIVVLPHQLNAILRLQFRSAGPPPQHCPRCCFLP